MNFKRREIDHEDHLHNHPVPHVVEQAYDVEFHLEAEDFEMRVSVIRFTEVVKLSPLCPGCACCREKNKTVLYCPDLRFIANYDLTESVEGNLQRLVRKIKDISVREDQCGDDDPRPMYRALFIKLFVSEMEKKMQAGGKDMKSCSETKWQGKAAWN